MARRTNPRLMSEVAQRIRRIRAERELSQEALSERAGVPVETISRIENGRLNPSLPTLAALAEGLATRLSSLVDPAPPPDLTPEEIEVLRGWRCMPGPQRDKLREFLRTYVP